MPKALYSANAVVRGGRDGRGETSDGALAVDLRMPTEMGGKGGGTNPEQLFAVGYAACFDGAIGVAARRRRVDVGETSIDSSVTLMPNAAKGFDLAVVLDVTLAGVDDPEEAVALVRAAHETCPYSNATRGNIDVELIANGRPVA
jgi:Ohr subfamily peroxiredoxin